MAIKQESRGSRPPQQGRRDSKAHKATAVFALALFLALLLVSFSAGQESKELEIIIEPTCIGDWNPEHGQGNFHPTHWDFAASLGDDPGAIGLIWSGGPGIIEGHGNGPCCFHIIVEVFKKTGGGPAKWIETWVSITVGDAPTEIYHVVNGSGEDKGSMSFWWTVPYYPAGSWTIEVDLGVMRSGYADPAGTYTSKVHMNIANTQNGCPPGHQQGPP